MMTDETRRILKVFGVAVTDFEAEQERIAERLSASAGSPAEEVAVLRSVCEQLLRLQEKWMEATQLVFEAQRTLLRGVLGPRNG